MRKAFLLSFLLGTHELGEKEEKVIDFLPGQTKVENTSAAICDCT